MSSRPGSPLCHPVLVILMMGVGYTSRQGPPLLMVQLLLLPDEAAPYLNGRFREESVAHSEGRGSEGSEGTKGARKQKAFIASPELRSVRTRILCLLSFGSHARQSHRGTRATRALCVTCTGSSTSGYMRSTIQPTRDASHWHATRRRQKAKVHALAYPLYSISSSAPRSAQTNAQTSEAKVEPCKNRTE